MGGGGIWRDAATHEDASTGKTFAYVAAQGTQPGVQEEILTRTLLIFPTYQEILTIPIWLTQIPFLRLVTKTLDILAKDIQ